MNLDYDNIIKEKQIDKFLQNNKFDPELINDFLKYICLKEKIEYLVLKDILINLIDTKNYTEIPSIFLSLVNSDYDLIDLVDVCSKLSVNIMQKFKGSPLLLKILNLLVDIAGILYLKEWFYECTIILYTSSLFITNCGVSNESLFLRYYELISKILLKSDNFYSALNVLTFINEELIDEKLASLCKYKNEGNKYSQFLLKMKYKEFEGNFNGEYDENWDFYVKNIGNRIPFNRENIKFISFMSKNNLNFVREGFEIVIGEYKYQSVDSKIHDIIDLYTIKENKAGKCSTESKKVEVKQVEKKKVEKRKEVKFADNFSVRKAKFNIYCDILKNTYKVKDIDYDMRNNIRKQNHEKYIQAFKEKKEFFEGFKDELAVMLNKLYALKKESKTSYIRPEIQSKVKSWRDEVDEPSNPTPYKPTIRKKEEIQSDRKIFTYGETAGSYNTGEEAAKSEGTYKPNVTAYKQKEDAFRPNVSAYKHKLETIKSSESAFKPNVSAYKPSESAFKPNVSAYKPSESAFKPEAHKTVSNENVFKPNFSGVKKDEEKAVRPNLRNLASKSDKWYDDSDKK